MRNHVKGIIYIISYLCILTTLVACSSLPWPKFPTKIENDKQKEDYQVERDSVIKRFELAIDTLWKYIKFFLETKFGVVHNSPKPVFRECLKNNLITEQDATNALKMIDIRNLASNTYKEEIAEEIVKDLPQMHELIRKFINNMKI